MSPKGKTIIITGAASGLGRAWAEGFHAEEAIVIAADINEAGLASLPDGVLTCCTDVSQESQVLSMIDLAVSHTGRLDALFNNAGYGLPHALEDFPPQSFEQLVAVHLFSTVYAMRAAIPIMRKQAYGRIINTLSRHAEASQPNSSAYAVAKAGLWTLSRSTAKEVSGSGVLINMLLPGPTNTGIWGKDMPDMQSAEVTYPTARMLALLADDGPNGKVYWNEKEYRMYEHLYDSPADG